MAKAQFVVVEKIEQMTGYKLVLLGNWNNQLDGADAENYTRGRLAILVSELEFKSANLGETVHVNIELEGQALDVGTIEQAREIVNSYYSRRRDREEYHVRVDLVPNPLDFDGCDEVYAKVIRKRNPRYSGEPEEELLATPCSNSVSEALAALKFLVENPHNTPAVTGGVPMEDFKETLRQAALSSDDPRKRDDPG